MSKVIVHRHAAKYLQRLPKKTKERIKNILKKLEENPLEQPNVKHMVGDWAGYHRIRVGEIRIIFWFDEREDLVYVDHVGPRGDVYK
jgi:mRNA interferase RelE/StbE